MTPTTFYCKSLALNFFINFQCFTSLPDSKKVPTVTKLYKGIFLKCPCTCAYEYFCLYKQIKLIQKG